MSSNTTTWKRYLSPFFLSDKVHERGIVWCFKDGLRWADQQIQGPRRYFIAPIMRPIMFFIDISVFLFSLSSFLSDRKPKKVVLGVWDYKLVPWSVGDFLVFIETLSVLKLRHNADKVDVCVVCDSDNPAGNRGYKNINSSNFRYYLFNLLPIVNTSPYLGSLFQFDSRSEFHSFLKQNINNYEIYPSVSDQLKETYNLYGGATLKEIRDFYQERGFIPYLSIDDYHRNWAYEFYQTKAKGLLPVSVSMRNRPDGPDRNADRHAWLDFFNLCASAFPDVVFVVVGVREEVFEELRGCSNVIIAKDHGSTVADDLALIRTSLLYMGMESGVAVIAIFSDVPYILFGRLPEEVERKGLNPGANWDFATQYQKQRYTDFNITPDSLLNEFTALYSQLDIDEWQRKASAYQSTPYTFVSWGPNKTV
ncbi:MAG: hypothetical protein SVY53_02990 [Chloroflexota bacterium]|nr:hypothetical protein [Chloroflexota bacterium]